MIPLFNNTTIRNADQFAINELGIPGIILMENAAISCYNLIIDNYSFKEGIIGVVCGKGNNGGDGFALARHFLINGFTVKILLIANVSELKGDAKLNYNILENLSKKNNTLSIKNFNDIKDIKFLNDCALIVDAILGSGSNGILEEPLKSIVESLNSINSLKTAIDIPTGLNINTGYGETVFNADLTICLTEFKSGLFYGYGYSYSGKVLKGDIGIDKIYFDDFQAQEYLIEPEDAFEGLPARNKTAHKYSSGAVLVIAGSNLYPGAAVLCANSSLISGAGATMLAIPETIKDMIFPTLFESTISSYNDENKGYFTLNSILQVEEKIKKSDVIALGCGLGRKQETIDACAYLLNKYSEKTFVIDADGIYCIATYGLQNFSNNNMIFTPHLAEFSILTGVSIEDLKKDLIFYGRNFVKNTNSYLVLKGSPTLIFNPEGEVFINTTGNSGMAKFGMGDVLTGIISSFIAQSKNIEKSLISAVYLHSLSADLLVEEKSEYGLTAGDIIKEFPKTINFLRASVV